MEDISMPDFPVQNTITSLSKVLGLNDDGETVLFTLEQLRTNNIGQFKTTDATPPTPLLNQNYDLIGTAVGASPSGTYTNLLGVGSVPIVIPAPATNHAIINATAVWNGTYWVPLWSDIALPSVDLSTKTIVTPGNILTDSDIINGNVGATGAETTTATWRKTKHIPVTPLQPLVFSADNFVPSASKHAVYFTAGGTYLAKKTMATSADQTFTPPATTSYIVINLYEPGDAIIPSNISLITNTAIETVVNKVDGKRVLGLTRVMGYSELKTEIAASSLTVGESFIVTGGPAGTSFIARVIAVNAIDTDIKVLGLDYDFYKINISLNTIYAYDTIAAVIRNTAGTWAYITTGGHTPKGFSGISQTTNQVTVIYNKTYTDVGSLTCSPDETYTLNGIIAGASVGLSNSILNYSCNGLTGSVEESGGVLVAVNTNGFQSPIKSVTMNTTTGNITIIHSALSYSGISFVSKNIAHRLVLFASSSASIVLKVIDNSGAVVLSPIGISFDINRTGIRTLLNSEMGVSGSNIWLNGIMMTKLV